MGLCDLCSQQLSGFLCGLAVKFFTLDKEAWGSLGNNGVWNGTCRKVSNRNCKLPA